MMDKITILNYLSNIEATLKFASTYGFSSSERLKEIQNEMSYFLGVAVDLADSSGMGKTAKKFNFQLLIEKRTNQI